MSRSEVGMRVGRARLCIDDRCQSLAVEFDGAGGPYDVFSTDVGNAQHEDVVTVRLTVSASDGGVMIDAAGPVRVVTGSDCDGKCVQLNADYDERTNGWRQEI